MTITYCNIDDDHQFTRHVNQIDCASLCYANYCMSLEALERTADPAGEGLFLSVHAADVRLQVPFPGKALPTAVTAVVLRK